MESSTRVGRIVHISRGYTVAEIVETPSGGGDDRVVGYTVFGHRSDTALIFDTQEKAMAELNDLASAADADLKAAHRRR